MKNLKRFMAAALAMTVLFATTVMAQTPREILSQAYASSMDATTMSISGNISGTVYMMGVQFLQLNMDLHMDMDVDLDTGAIKMYMRMPMQISGVDPTTGESMNEDVEVAVFMDGDTFYVYEATIGWFTDPSMDMADLGDIMGLFDLEELTAGFLELNEQIMDQITIQFADDQVDGFYVIEQFLTWEDLAGMMDEIFASDMFADMMNFMPQDDFAGLELTEEELAEVEAMMEMMAGIMDDMEFELDAVFRSYINQETLEFEVYGMLMNLDFALEMDLGEEMGGVLEISGSFVIDLDVIYNPTIVWPVIDAVAQLDDILADVVAAEEAEDALAVVETFDLVFGEAELEDRIAGTLDQGMTSVIVNLDVADIANFNVFIVNNGSEAVTIALAPAFNQVLQPGEGFVMQIPAGTLGADAALIIEGAGAPLNVETGFRLTNYPLGS